MIINLSNYFKLFVSMCLKEMQSSNEPEKSTDDEKKEYISSFFSGEIMNIELNREEHITFQTANLYFL